MSDNSDVTSASDEEVVISELEKLRAENETLRQQLASGEDDALGSVTGTGVDRTSRYVLEATFTLPAGVGFLDAQATFPGPNMPMFGRTVAFEVSL